MSTEKTRKNPDYAESAVNLTNLPGMANRLNYLRQAESLLQDLENEADYCVPLELKERIVDAEINVDEIKKDILHQIDEIGSYQNPETGAYAVKQKKQSLVYDPKPFLEAASDSILGQACPLVIEPTVNVKALDGLIKGGILHEQNLRDEGVIKPGKVSYSYIIKAGETK